MSWWVGGGLVRCCLRSGSKLTGSMTTIEARTVQLEIKPIRNDVDHEEALREIQRLWGSKEGTPKGDRLDVLTTLAEAYERKHFPIDAADPIEAIRFRLEQQGLDHRALVGVMGGRNRVYEVLHRKRDLSLEMIRRLNERFGIPAEVLIHCGAQRSEESS